MSEQPGAILIAEIGSVTTRVTLLNSVEGQTRWIGQASMPSTAEPPYHDLTIGMLQAAKRIGDLTGHVLLRDGHLITPQVNEREGVNHVLVATSASERMKLVIMGIASDISARSALHAAQCIYSDVQQVVTLDDAANNPELRRTTSWVERQVQALLAHEPDTIILAGGLEDSNNQAICRMAQTLAFVVQQQQHMSRKPGAPPTPVIYAGASSAHDCVRAALGEHADLTIVDNLRPTLEHERLEPIRRELVHRYSQHMLPAIPGFGALQNIASSSITTTVEAQGLLTRFFAERYNRRVLLLDVGGTSSSALFASPGSYTLAVNGLAGTGYSAMALVAQRGLAAIARWLPYTMPDQELRERLLNWHLRPQMVPSDRDDVLLEHALVREALSVTYGSLTDEHPNPDYDMVIGCGNPLTEAYRPGLAALSLLDSLQTTAADSTLAIDLRLDRLGLMAGCGVLASLDAEAALLVAETDLLRHTPLATCIIPLGNGKVGDVALEAELTSSRGSNRSVTVHHGEIARIPLPPGQRAGLTIRPRPGVRIGRNEPGAEVVSDPDAISGSELGIIIDARGRPLQLPDNAQQRSDMLWGWLVALGVERGNNPYQAVDYAPEEPTEAPLPDTLPGLPDFDEPPLPGTATPDTLPVPATPALAADTPTLELPDVDTLLGNPPPPPAPSPAEAPTLPPTPMPPLPLADAPTATGAPGTPPAAAPQGKRISLADLAQDEQGDAPPPPVPAPPEPTNPPTQTSTTGDDLLDDLRALRESQPEPPPKRGRFGLGRRKS